MSRVVETLYSSRLVKVPDVVCSERCGDGRHEEQCLVASLAFVRTGPPAASVTHVHSEWEESNQAPSGMFEIR